jgi:hypothetical protein
MFDMMSQTIYKILDIRKLHTKISSGPLVFIPKFSGKETGKSNEAQLNNALLENNVSFSLFSILDRTCAPVTKSADVSAKGASKQAEAAKLQQPQKQETLADIMENTLKSLSISLKNHNAPMYLTQLELTTVYSRQWKT